MSQRWRTVNASVGGTSHVRSATPCQDASLCVELRNPLGKSILIATVSDGAGSAAEAATGSRLACETLVAAAKPLIASGELEPPERAALIDPWISLFRERIDAAASEAGLARRDYACTLLAAVVAEQGALFIQVGDGAIVVRETAGDDFSWVFWPQSGEYANTTYFATDPTLDQHLQIAVTKHGIGDIAMFSDGLQPLVLDYSQRITHAPFFRKMFQAVRNANPYDRTVLERSLAAYLNSSIVNDRTDDDKTLLLASYMDSTHAVDDQAETEHDKHIQG
jgi:hypothetical protein